MKYFVEDIKQVELRYITTIVQSPGEEKQKYNNVRILYMKEFNTALRKRVTSYIYIYYKPLSNDLSNKEKSNG